VTTKLLGKFLVVEWLPTGGTLGTDEISIATKSRNFKVSQKGNSIDVSVREDIAANEKDKLPDAPDRTAELSGLDTDEATPDWEALEVGDKGTLTWYRQGKADTKPMRSASATVTGSDFGSPHDNANDWSISWDITSAIDTGTYDATP
jgi:hypothetical protein